MFEISSIAFFIPNNSLITIVFKLILQIIVNTVKADKIHAKRPLNIRP